MNRWFWILIRVCLSLILLGYLFQKTDLSKFSEIFRTLDLTTYVVSLISYTLLFIPLSYRWQILLQALGIRVPLERLLTTYLVGVFFNNFLPTAIGGDFVRGLDLYRFTQKGKEAAVSVMAERFLGLAALLVIAVTALAFSYSSLQDPFLIWLILISALGYLIILLGLCTPTLFILTAKMLQQLKLQGFGQKLLKIPEAITLYKSSPRTLIFSAVLSILLQALTVLIYYTLSLSLHLKISLAYLFLFFPVINIVSMAPVSLGGLGVREGMTVYLFQKVGMDPGHALGLSLAWFSIIFLTSLLGGVVFALRNVRGFPPSPSPSEKSEYHCFL
ncbi:MAG TPA: lysylphosphatidylglycerol synthase transmembrane domain-containing protein [Nitrospiria bacterium]|nr:lysylphosphatidylglycerol synthase transmembrane domain-containing protein [Nitrospiria bacterium]